MDTRDEQESGREKLPQTHFTAVVWFFRSTGPVLFSNFYDYVLVEYIPQRLVKSKQSRSIIIRFLQFPQFFGKFASQIAKSNESIFSFRLFAREFAARFIELITKNANLHKDNARISGYRESNATKRQCLRALNCPIFTNSISTARPLRTKTHPQTIHNNKLRTHPRNWDESKFPGLVLCCDIFFAFWLYFVIFLHLDDGTGLYAPDGQPGDKSHREMKTKETLQFELGETI